MAGWYDWDQMAGSAGIALAATGLFLLILIIGGLALLARADEQPPESPEVLNERLARGDITPEEHSLLLAARGEIGPDTTSRL